MRKLKFAMGAVLLGLTVAIAVGAISAMTAMLFEALEVFGRNNQQLAQVLVFGPALLTIALTPICSIIYYNLRYKHKAIEIPGDTALVQELARRAQDLSQRMEALETILLARSDHYRETAGRS